MSVYKVPQDVEAEDKLLGPFTFRQFVYLMITAGGIAAGFFLYQASPFLVLIPLPVVIVFGTLALPLKKDQPMETYVAAIIRFYLKPNDRIWQPDGTQSLVEVTAPILDDSPQTKLFGGEEARQRLSFLSSVVDTQGWASRGVYGPVNNTSVSSDILEESYNATDILDATGSVAQSFDSLIASADQRHKEEMLAKLQQSLAERPNNVSTTPQSVPTRQQPIVAAPAVPQFQPQTAQAPNPQAVQLSAPTQSTQQTYGPVQRQLTTTNTQATTAPLTTTVPTTLQAQQGDNVNSVTKSPNPDIMRLANNDGLTIDAVAREAKRLSNKGNDIGDEIDIPLH